MYKNETKRPTNSPFKKNLTELKADFKLDWKTMKEQFGIDMRNFAKFLKRLLITDKKQEQIIK